jgi:hypothetical protein
MYAKPRHRIDSAAYFRLGRLEAILGVGCALFTATSLFDIGVELPYLVKVAFQRGPQVTQAAEVDLLLHRIPLLARNLPEVECGLEQNIRVRAVGAMGRRFSLFEISP